MNQSEFKANTCNRRQAERGKTRALATNSRVGLASHTSQLVEKVV